MHHSARLRGTVLLSATLLGIAPGAAMLSAQDDLARPIVYAVPGMDQAAVQRDLTYKTDGAIEMKMDVYAPPGLDPAARRPAVIFIHGGFLPPEMRPKEWGVFTSYGRLMAASGLIGVTFNHRYHGFDEKSLDMSFGDVADAIAYVRKNASRLQVDPERIALWAFSGGGPHLSLALRESLPYVRCLVSYYAILDISEATLVRYRVPRATVAKYLPVSYLTDQLAAMPPILIGRAGLDGLSLNRSLQEFTTKALALGATLEVLNHPTGRHGFDILDDDPRSRQVIARTVEFLKTHLSSDTPPDARAGFQTARVLSALASGNIDGAKKLVPLTKAGRLPERLDPPALERVFSESYLGRLAYQLSYGGAPEAAVAISKWAVELYPDSPNALDSLAHAHEMAGDKKAAVAVSQRALAMLEQAASLSSEERARLRDALTARLKRLE